MNRIIQITIYTLFFFGGWNNSKAQTSEKPMCLEANVGIREYLGDWGSSVFFQRKPIYQGAGINFGYYLNNWFDAVGNFTFGDVGYRTIIDWKPDPYRLRGFKANTFDVTVGTRVKLPTLANAKIMPYIHAAFGGYYTHSKPYYNVAITDMGANLQGGAGVSFRINPTWGLRWSFTSNYTMNDRWDGANGQKDGEDLVHRLFRTNDMYTHHAIGITYSFGNGTGPRKLKDKDGDGIPDKYDICKETEEKYWEFVDSVGCPTDSDKDGVLDGDDLCRLVAGKKMFAGCPDSDNDSIQDSKDECPQVFGLAKYNGCPDTDGDGISDKNDICPQVAGLKQFDGCPDTDGDGVQDSKDKCPKVAGAIEGEGCPDTDGDGVYDNIDKCKDKPGTIANKGCPEVSKEAIKKIALAAQGINFETGKDIIKATSFPNIDKLVLLLNEYAEAKVEIQGHTDNAGDRLKNLDLSQRRANAVKAYLESHGISADRLTALGFGPDQPIAENTSPAGKAKNRRVDFKLNY